MAGGGGGEQNPKRVRGPKLVAKVLETTLGELGRVGYEKLSIEQVAERAQVNKVTIYRHWPTKLDLARAALRHVADEHVSPVDTGSLRGDLVVFLRSLNDVVDSPTSRGILGVLFAGSEGDELVKLAESISEEKDQQMLVVYKRAVARGEIPRGVDYALVHAVLCGAVVNVCIFERQRLNDRDIDFIIDLILAGLAALPRRRPKRGRRVSR